jgi:hypothetical protein
MTTFQQNVTHFLCTELISFPIRGHYLLRPAYPPSFDYRCVAGHTDYVSAGCSLLNRGTFKKHQSYSKWNSS